MMINLIKKVVTYAEWIVFGSLPELPVKNMFLKISKYLQENTCVGISFLIKLQT